MSKIVLAVDDSRTMRDMVTFTLEEAGYKTLSAEHGQAGLDVLDINHVDVIITDLNMPVMNGFEFIKKVRANVKFKYTPILILTTEGDTTKKQEGREAGATGWIVKPFNPEKLIDVVKKVSPL